MGGRLGGWRLAGSMAAWLGGVALQLQQPALWPVWTYLAMLAAALLVWPLRRRAGLLMLAVATVSFGWAGHRAHERLADRLPAALEGRELIVVATIAELPRYSVDGVRFVAEVEAARDGESPVRVPARLSLGWYGGGDDGAALGAGPHGAVGAGERWQFAVRLRRPHGLVNPHGFDQELWWFERGIGANGTVRGGPHTRRLEVAAAHPVERLRQWVRDAINARVDDVRAAGVLAALAIGDQGAIHRADWDVFRATGVAHLMAISGLHVTMFAWIAGGVIAALWRRSGRLALACPAPTAARWGGVLAAAAYAVLAGWGVPAQRTVWMLATAALLMGAGVRWPWPLVLLAAAAVVTAIDPWALLQPGFWLSFVAVGLLMASSPGEDTPRATRWRDRAWSAAQGAVRTQVVATLGLAPLTLLFFQQVSVVGFVANLLAIPVVTLLVTPLALLGVVAPVLWSGGAAVLQALGAVLAMFAGWPGAVWTAAAAPTWAQAAGLLGGTLLVLPLPWRLKWLGVVLLLPLLAPPVARPEHGRFELVALDVGQGGAALVRTRTHLLVYDTGPRYGRDSDAGRRVLVPLLHARGERHVDRLVLSHRDIDHVGGASALLAALPVRSMWGSLEDGHPLREAGVPFDDCHAGQQWQWDGVRFDMLHPPADAPTSVRRSNAFSCVLRISDAAGRSVLLTGDIEATQEAELVAHHGPALASDVLFVPHHGSGTSSSEALIDAVAPRVALVQAGYRNRFGHPAPAVVARYASRGITLVHSAHCGAWTWRDDAAHCERTVRARYWHHREAERPSAAAAPPGAP